MAVNDDRRDLIRVFIAEGLDNHLAGLLLVLARDLCRRHCARAGDRTVEIVAMRRAERRNRHAGLRKGRCPAGMRMYDAADIREGAIQFDVRRGVRGRAKRTFDNRSVQINHDHIIRRHVLIFHTRRLDNDQALFPVDTGYITPGKCDELVLWEQEIGFQHLLLELFQHSVSPLLISASMPDRTRAAAA